MRGGIVAAGVVMLLLSFFGWMLVIFNPLIGAVLCLLSPVLFIIGLVLFIVGLVISPPQQTQIYVQQSIPTAAPMANVCPVCGRSMTYYPQKGRWYCHSCRQYR
jgi:ABC-type multidrug transport system permease subunit